MPSIRPEDLTPFGRAALKLDRELSELARVGDQIARVDLDSDNGLDEGIRLLNRVAEYGQSVAGTMQEFSTTLDDARAKADAATKLVSERAQVIQRRRQQQDLLQQKLSKIKEDVKASGASLAGFAAPSKDEPAEEQKRRMAAELERLQAPMTAFIEAIQAVKTEAAAANFKRLERQAEAMIDSLKASRRKISQAIAPPPGS